MTDAFVRVRRVHDTEVTVRRYREAAKHGMVEAQYNLAVCLDRRGASAHHSSPRTAACDVRMRAAQATCDTHDATRGWWRTTHTPVRFLVVVHS